MSTNDWKLRFENETLKADLADALDANAKLKADALLKIRTLFYYTELLV
jgi:hypothetical protein